MRKVPNRTTKRTKRTPATTPNEKVAEAIRRASDAADFDYVKLHDAIWTDDDNRLKSNEEKSDRIRQDLSNAKFAAGDLRKRYVQAVLKLCYGTVAYDPFLESMETLEVLYRRLRTDPFEDGTHEIVFVTPEKTTERKLRQREEQAELRLMKAIAARQRAELTKPNLVRMYPQDGKPSMVDTGEEWRRRFADADSARR